MTTYKFWHIIRLCADENKMRVAYDTFLELGFPEQAEWVRASNKLEREKYDYDIGLTLCLAIARKLDRCYFLGDSGYLSGYSHKHPREESGEVLSIAECIERFGSEVAEDCVEFGRVQIWCSLAHKAATDKKISENHPQNTDQLGKRGKISAFFPRRSIFKRAK